MGCTRRRGETQLAGDRSAQVSHRSGASRQHALTTAPCLCWARPPSCRATLRLHSLALVRDMITLHRMLLKCATLPFTEHMHIQPYVAFCAALQAVCGSGCLSFVAPKKTFHSIWHPVAKLTQHSWKAQKLRLASHTGATGVDRRLQVPGYAPPGR